MLARSLASQELLGEARAGLGSAMAGSGATSGRALRDAARLAEQYGGSASDWAKMTTRSRVAGGANISVHWYENVRTGARVEFKTPINR
jgi:hypothetical protein